MRKYEGWKEKIVELYPDGYSKEWREHEDMSINDLGWSHYLAKYKEHEANRTSTNERNEYWRKYSEDKRTM